MNYYYLENNEAIGPCTADELEQLFNTGTITLSTQIAEEGSQTWKGYRTYYRQRHPDAKRSFTKKPKQKEAPQKQPVICVIFNFLGYLCLASAAFGLLVSFITTTTEQEYIASIFSSALGGLFWLALSAIIKKKCY